MTGPLVHLFRTGQIVIDSAGDEWRVLRVFIAVSVKRGKDVQRILMMELQMPGSRVVYLAPQNDRFTVKLTRQQARQRAEGKRQVGE